MSSKRCVSPLLFIAFMQLVLKGIYSQCTEFVEIPESDYDRTYYTINSVQQAARPLGFQRESLRFDENTDLCYSVSGVGDGRSIEIMFESVPPSIMCMRDGTDDECHERFTKCRAANSNPEEFHFYIDVAQGSTESDVNFWLRITKGPPYANDTEEMWCMSRDSMYPESLATLPPFVTPGPTPDIIGAASLTTWSFLLIVTTVLILLNL